MDVAAASSAPGVLAVYTPFDGLGCPSRRRVMGETWVPLRNTDVAYRGQPIAS